LPVRNLQELNTDNGRHACSRPDARLLKLALSSNVRRVYAHRFYETLGFERHGLSFAVFLDEI
jgi:hypothetical protein